MELSKRSEIEKYLKDNNYDITKRMLWGSMPKIAKQIGISTLSLQHYLSVLRGTKKRYKYKRKYKAYETYEERKIGKIDAVSSKDIRGILNKKIGSIIYVKDFVQRTKVSSYLSKLYQSGYLDRIYTGEYKVLKKIVLKKRKGVKKENNYRLKDLSTLPAILNSSKDGLVMRQIQTIYENITPKEKQVNALYLYRILGFAKKQGLIENNGVNKKMRGIKGPYPTRIKLTNPHITTEEWKQLVKKYRMWYQYKKENKNKRVSSPKTVMEKFKNSDSIIHNFDEDRDNQNKQFVEDYFFNIVQKHLGEERINCFAITGPDYFRHVTKLFNTIANKVTICELQPDIFDVIYRKAQVCPYYIDKKVSLYKGDVNDLPWNCQYIDLDLMACIDSISETIVNQVNNQSRACDGLKFITFTTSTRNDGGVDVRLSKLKNLLNDSFGLKLKGFQGGEGFGEGVELFNKTQSLNFCLQRIPKIIDYGKVKDICIFTYIDHSPMMSVLLVYK